MAENNIKYNISLRHEGCWANQFKEVDEVGLAYPSFVNPHGGYGVILGVEDPVNKQHFSNIILNHVKDHSKVRNIRKIADGKNGFLYHIYAHDNIKNPSVTRKINELLTIGMDTPLVLSNGLEYVPLGYSREEADMFIKGFEDSFSKTKIIDLEKSRIRLQGSLNIQKKGRNIENIHPAYSPKVPIMDMICRISPTALTENELYIFKNAVDKGYYHKPRKIDDTEMAELLSITKEKFLDNIMQIEKKIFPILLDMSSKIW